MGWRHRVGEKGRDGKIRGEVFKVGRSLKMDRRTPGYLVREELQKEKLKERAGRRA